MLEKINEIHTFGTSHTAGGGFEFDKKPNVKNFYKDLGEELSMYNFSWPGRLHKQIKIPIFNHAKQGFGDDRMYRKFYEVFLNSSNLKNKLFIFEFAQLGRKEFFSTTINDYIIANYYGVDSNGNTFHDLNKLNSENIKVNISNDYYNEDSRIKFDKNTYREFIKINFKVEHELKSISRNALFFISFLLQNNINFLILQNPLLTNKDFDLYSKLFDFRKKEIYFDDKQTSYFVDFVDENSITKETNGIIIDGHAGFDANNRISNVVLTQIKKEYILENEYL